MIKRRSTEPLYKHRVSRRAILRGVGASLTLPFLPSLKPSARASEALAAGVMSSEAPRRYLAMVFSNGINVDHWWQRTDEANRVVEVGKSLEALRPHLDDVLFVNDLHLFDRTQGVHMPYFTNFLVGVEVPQGSVPTLDRSIDQYMARTVGLATPVPSMVLGIEPTSFGLSNGRPAIYRGTISWSSPTSPITPEIYPAQVFDRLFDTSTLVQDRSVLDYVLGEAKALRSGLASQDREKLDAYMESIRSIERRIEVATQQGRLEGWRPSLLEPTMERPHAGTPQDLEEHMKLMIDLAVLALQMDKTRIGTLLLELDLSYMQFDFLEGVGRTGLHNLSHHQYQMQALEEYQITNAYHVGLLAYMLEKMKGIDEGNNTTLLDNTAILFGTTMGDGHTHDGDHLRLVVAGGKSMGIQGGRALTYDKLEDRRLCNLHLDMAQRMGCKIEDFSNAHYPLPGVGG